MIKFSGSWASALCSALNANGEFIAAAADWGLGALGFVVVPIADEDAGPALSLSLKKGTCERARILPTEKAYTSCKIVLESTAEHWGEIFSGKLTPTMALMTGKVKLTRGSISALIPFTRAFECLIDCAPPF